MADINGFDPVPMFIADRALHSAETVRAFVYDSTGGEEGVVGPNDLKVQALAQPGAAVRINTGGYVVLNRSAGGAGQSYAGRAYKESRLDTPTTTAVSGGSWMVVARVEDTQYSPWEPYLTLDQKRVGPYVFPRLLPCQNWMTRASDLGLPHSMIALARIDLPASTAAVQPTHIVDLRQLVNARERSRLQSQATPPNVRLPKLAAPVVWPAWEPTFDVPIWANYINAKIDIGAIGVDPLPTDGELFGKLTFEAGGELVSGAQDVDLDPGASGGGSRQNFFVTVGGWIPAAALGQNRKVKVSMLGRIYTTSQGQIGTNAGSHMAIDIRFSQRLV